MQPTTKVDLRFGLSIVIPLLALAVAWGSLRSDMKNVLHDLAAISADVSQIEKDMVELKLDNREFRVFTDGWHSQWGHLLRDDNSGTGG